MEVVMDAPEGRSFTPIMAPMAPIRVATPDRSAGTGSPPDGEAEMEMGDPDRPISYCDI